MWEDKTSEEIFSNLGFLLSAISECRDRNVMWISRRTYVAMIRSGMTKRQYRRWRGKQKALRREFVEFSA